MEKTWSQQEINDLEELWGKYSIETISTKLGRSIIAIKAEALKLKLGPFLLNSEYMSVNSIAKELNICHHTMGDWCKLFNFPYINKKVSKVNRVRCVKLNEFWKWAEKYKYLIDFSKLEVSALGKEPEWVSEKRKYDERKALLLKPYNSVWSNSEIGRLKYMLNKGYTYPAICLDLKRTQGAVKRKISDLNIKLRPEYYEYHKKYSEQDVQYIIEGLEKGISIEEMAITLNRTFAGLRGKLERMGYKFVRGMPYKEDGVKNDECYSSTKNNRHDSKNCTYN